MQLALKIYYKMETEVIRIWLGSKLLVGLMNPDDIEVQIKN